MLQYVIVVCDVWHVKTEKPKSLKDFCPCIIEMQECVWWTYIFFIDYILTYIFMSWQSVFYNQFYFWGSCVDLGFAKHNDTIIVVDAYLIFKINILSVCVFLGTQTPFVLKKSCCTNWASKTLTPDCSTIFRQKQFKFHLIAQGGEKSALWTTLYVILHFCYRKKYATFIYIIILLKQSEQFVNKCQYIRLFF